MPALALMGPPALLAVPETREARTTTALLRRKPEERMAKEQGSGCQTRASGLLGER